VEELVSWNVDIPKHRPAILAFGFCSLELLHACAALLGTWYYSQHPDIRFSDTQSVHWSFKFMFFTTTMVTFTGQFLFIYAGYSVSKRLLFLDKLMVVLLTGLFLASCGWNIFGQSFHETIGSYFRIGPGFQGTSLQLSLIFCISSTFHFQSVTKTIRASRIEGNPNPLNITPSSIPALLFISQSACVIGFISSIIAFIGFILDDKFLSFKWIISDLIFKEFIGNLYPFILIYAIRISESPPPLNNSHFFFSNLPSLFGSTGPSSSKQHRWYQPWKVIRSGNGPLTIPSPAEARPPAGGEENEVQRGV